MYLVSNVSDNLQVQYWQNLRSVCSFVSCCCHVPIDFVFIPHGYLNTLRPRQNGRIFFNENVRISIRIPLNFVPKIPIDNKPALIQIMACRLLGAKPLSESILAYYTDAYMLHSAITHGVHILEDFLRRTSIWRVHLQIGCLGRPLWWPEKFRLIQNTNSDEKVDHKEILHIHCLNVYSKTETCLSSLFWLL